MRRATQANEGGGWRSRGAALAVGAALLAVAVTLLAGDAAIRVWAVILYDGAVAAAIVAAGTLCGRWINRGLFQRMRAAVALRVAAAAAMGLGVFALVLLGLGLAGWLSRGGVCAMIVALAAPGMWNARVGRAVPWLKTRAGWGWAMLPLAIPAAIALVGATLPPGAMWGDEPHGYDVVEYHLQVPREWHDAGRITLLDHNVFSAMPFNVEMLYLLGMRVRGGPWAGMYTAQFLHVALVGLTVLALAGSGRGGAVAALAAGMTPWMVMLAPMAYNEGGLLLLGTLAIVTGLRAMEGDWRVALWAGLFAGMAGGSKLTGVAMVAAALPVAIVLASWIRRGARRPTWRSGAAYAMGAMLTLSPWLVRTAAWTGNPVWPEMAGTLGAGRFSAAQVARWNAAHSPRPDQRSVAGRLSAGGSEIAWGWRYGYVLLPLALVVGHLHRRQREAMALGILLALMAGVWLFATHLQGRFFVSAIPVAALMMGLARTARGRGIVVALLIAQGFVGWTGLGVAERGLVPRLMHFTEAPWAAAVGLDDLSMLLPEDGANAVASGRPVVLIGDAAAFRYPVPSKRLYYKTVFDVPADAPDAAAAWTRGIPATVLAKAIRLVNESELRRFAATYRNIPPASVAR